MKTQITTDKAPRPPETSGYSQAIVGNNLIFTAGQIHLTVDGQLVEGTIEEKTHQVMKNLEAILKEAGVSFTNVLKTTIYITDMINYEKVITVYREYMSQPYPARETVCVKALPLGAKIEISMIASK